MDSTGEPLAVDGRTLRRAVAAFELDCRWASAPDAQSRLARLRTALLAQDVAGINAICLEVERIERPVTRGTPITGPIEGNRSKAPFDDIVLLRNKLIEDLDGAIEDLGADERH